MPAQRRGDRLATGETIQEHELDHQKDRRDQQASDQGQQSPTKAKAPTKRETWLDWMPEGDPEPDLYTRDEIAEMASGIDPVTGDDLRYWEYQGVLPRSIRRRHQGATRAVYPEWYVGIARKVRELQRHGLSLEEIKPRIRDHYEMMHVAEGSYSKFEPSPALTAELNRLAHALSDEVGSPPDHIEVHITLANGSGSIYSFPVIDNNK